MPDPDRVAEPANPTGPAPATPPLDPEAVTDHPAPVRPPDGARGMKAVLKKVRSQRQTSDPALDGLIKEVRAKRPKADTKAIERAYFLAERAHAGQTRKSGDPFITHPVSVAMILAHFGLDETTISAALLHDAVEDTTLSLVDVEAEMGYDVAQLIDGVTKLERIKFRSAEQSRAENLRKMIVATAKDVRVLLIKIADRLHNMRTLAPLNPRNVTHRAEDPRDLRAAGPPPRHVRHEVGARGPRVRNPPPETLRRDRGSGVTASAGARAGPR